MWAELTAAYISHAHLISSNETADKTEFRYFIRKLSLCYSVSKNIGSQLWLDRKTPQQKSCFSHPQTEAHIVCRTGQIPSRTPFILLCQTTDSRVLLSFSLNCYSTYYFNWLSQKYSMYNCPNIFDGSRTSITSCWEKFQVIYLSV